MCANRRPPTDSRRARRQAERAFLIAAILLLVVVGAALIALFFGRGEMLASLPCLLAGAGAMAGLYGLLALVERWRND